MADIANKYYIGTDPEIYHTVSYDIQRSGTTIKVRYKVVTSAIQSPSYFGYNLKLNISLNGTQVLTGGVIKENSPNTWSQMTKYFPSSTGWYQVTGIGEVSTLATKITFTTNSPSTANKTVSGTVAVPSYTRCSSPTTVTTSASVVAQTTTNFTLSWSGAKAGSTSIAKYTVYYSVGSGWKKLKDVTTTSTSGKTTVNLNGITSTRGTAVSFTVRTVDTLGYISTATPQTKVTLASNPTSPTTVTTSADVVPYTFTDFTISWSGASAGSGSISKYIIYYKVGTGSWTQLNETTSTSIKLNLEGITNLRGTSVKFAVRTVNSYSLLSTLVEGVDIFYALVPDAPTNINLSTVEAKRNENVTISWSGASAGTGEIDFYMVDVRRYTNGSWSDWIEIAQTEDTSYVFDIDVIYPSIRTKDMLQFRVGVQNTYGLTDGTYFNSITVTIRGGIVQLNVNGEYKEGYVYVKVDGIWREATEVYTKDTEWKESI